MFSKLSLYFFVAVLRQSYYVTHAVLELIELRLTCLYLLSAGIAGKYQQAQLKM
jgi:hypothetical protein